MSLEQGIELVQQSLWLMLLLSGPVLLAALVVGLIISVIQAATQIQDQTLSFVPKIVGMGLVAILITPWVATMLLEFAEAIFSGRN